MEASTIIQANSNRLPVNVNATMESPPTTAAMTVTTNTPPTNKTTMSTEDVTSLIKLDAAGIILQAAKMEPHVLEQVTKFASQLTFYATLQGLITKNNNNSGNGNQQQQARTVSPNSDANNKDNINNAGAEQPPPMTDEIVNNINHQKKKTNNDNGSHTSPRDSLTDAAVDFMNNLVEHGQPFSPTTATTTTATTNDGKVTTTGAESATSPDADESTNDTETSATRRSHEEATQDKTDNAILPGTEPAPKRPRVDTNLVVAASTATAQYRFEQGQFIAITGTTGATTATATTTNDKENKAPKNTTKKKKPTAVPPPSVVAVKEREETISPAGYNGSIAQSQLQRSVGLTRAVLNQHYISLGLTACFGVPVISKQGQNVSHLTLNHRWNDLPYDETQSLKWWLGTGASRLNLASPLNPALVNPQPIIPIFFAQTNTGGGGALCHYVGHYQCNHFVTDQNVLFKTKPRQALIGFKFIRFDQAMADKLAKIAATVPTTTTVKSMEKHEVVNQDDLAPVEPSQTMMDPKQQFSSGGETSGLEFFNDSTDMLI